MVANSSEALLFDIVIYGRDAQAALSFYGGLVCCIFGKPSDVMQSDRQGFGAGRKT